MPFAPCLSCGGCQNIHKAPAYIDQALGLPLGIAAYVVKEVALHSERGAQKTARFVKENWETLLAYSFAWGVIITCTGMLYGFQAVAFPLTIGLGGGLGFGLVFGLLSGSFSDSFTPWNYLNTAIEHLDQNGTRQIVLAVAVTVVLAASVVFPYALGGVFGLFIAWQVAFKIANDQNLGSNKPYVDHETLQKEATELKASQAAKEIEIADLNTRLSALEQLVKSLQGPQ